MPDPAQANTTVPTKTDAAPHEAKEKALDARLGRIETALKLVAAHIASHDNTTIDVDVNDALTA